MSHINQENTTAWRFREFQHIPPTPPQASRYECEPPPDVRAELVQPRRPRILTRPPGPPQKPPQSELERSPRHPMLSWMLVLVGVAAVCTLIGLNWPSPEKRAAALQESAKQSREVQQKARESMEALRAGKPSVQPTPMPTPVQPVSQPSPPAVSAPRARLVLHKRYVGNSVYEITDSTGRVVKILVDPAPKAQLVRPPVNQSPLIPGQSYLATMPYGLQVLATYRGELPSIDLLPSHRNAIGDMYIVQNVPWIWLWAPGAAHADWIDP